MKKFNFRLQSLLNFRKEIELKSLRVLSDRQREHLAFKQMQEELAQKIDEMKERHYNVTDYDLKEVRQQEEYLRGLGVRLNAAQTAARKKESGVKKALGEYLKIKQQVKTLELLKEKQSSIFYKIFKRQEEKELDDLLNMQRAFRKSLETFLWVIAFSSFFWTAPWVFADGATAGTGATGPTFVGQTPVPKKKKHLGSTECLANESAIQDLKQLKEELNQKSKDLEARKTELDAREQHLQEELDKITKVREQLQAQTEDKKKADLERVSKIVETLLSMPPKSAAKILESFADSEALAVIGQLDAPKLGKMMAAMDAKRSKELSEKFMGLKR
jgi:flagellar motility protein MotE (MotC chaperone)